MPKIAPSSGHGGGCRSARRQTLEESARGLRGLLVAQHSPPCRVSSKKPRLWGRRRDKAGLVGRAKAQPPEQRERPLGSIYFSGP